MDIIAKKNNLIMEVERARAAGHKQRVRSVSCDAAKLERQIAEEHPDDPAYYPNLVSAASLYFEAGMIGTALDIYLKFLEKKDLPPGLRKFAETEVARIVPFDVARILLFENYGDFDKAKRQAQRIMRYSVRSNSISAETYKRAFEIIEEQEASK